MIGRRAVLVATAGVAGLVALARQTACSRRAPPLSTGPSGALDDPLPPSAGAATGAAMRTLSWAFDEGAISPRCVVLVPTWGGAAARFPVLVALHGRGEALKGPVEGCMGWPRDYDLVGAVARLRAPPLVAADLQGLLSEGQLARLNDDVAGRPFHGLIVVCPYLPDLNPRRDTDVAAYGRFVTEQLLPRVLRETPATPGAAIDGVSLGGAMALRVGLANPAAFAAVSGLQPAIAESQGPQWVELARAARARAPGLKLRLLTSEADVFRRDVTAVSEALRAGGVEHDFTLAPGPHDYPFNRGPGAMELLLWSDRNLPRV